KRRIAVPAVELAVVPEQRIGRRREDPHRDDVERPRVVAVRSAPLPIDTGERADRVPEAAAREQAPAPEVHRHPAGPHRRRAAGPDDVAERPRAVGLQRLEGVHVRRRDERAGVDQLGPRVHQLAEEPHVAASGLDEEARLQRENLIAPAQAGAVLIVQQLVARALLHAEIDARLLGVGLLRSGVAAWRSREADDGDRGDDEPRAMRKIKQSHRREEILCAAAEDMARWWPGAGSNHRHADFQSAALPTELPGHSRAGAAVASAAGAYYSGPLTGSSRQRAETAVLTALLRTSSLDEDRSAAREGTRMSHAHDLRAPSAAALAARYRFVRQATLDLTAPLAAEDHVVQAIPEASPTKWHLAHTTWFFERFCLLRQEKVAAGQPLLHSHEVAAGQPLLHAHDGVGSGDYEPFHPLYDRLFNSYYYTVGEMHPRPERGLLSRPTVAEIVAYREHVDEAMERLIERRGGDPELAFLIALGLNHEQQHQELLLTDVKQAFFANPLGPAYA